MNHPSPGLEYWKRIYDTLLSNGWKTITELWDEAIESWLFTNSAVRRCSPCSGLHLQETTDHCLHCEEVLQLSLFSILLSQAAHEKQCLHLIRNLFTKHSLCQKLVERFYASSVYISHLAGKVFVSLVSLNPFKYFTENGFGDLVLSFTDHPESHIDACKGFSMLKNILKTRLPKDVNAAYVAALSSSWTVIISTHKKHIANDECNLAFLTFWWKLFKSINQNSHNLEITFYKTQITNYFFQHMDFLCENFQSNWTNNEHLYRMSLKLFLTVLNYETDLSVRKTIPDVYRTISIRLLENGTFSQVAFSASVLRCKQPVRIGSSNFHTDLNPNVEDHESWAKCETIPARPLLNLPLLRKLILLEIYVCTIALRSENLISSYGSEGTNEQIPEKILLKLEQMCLFIHDNLEGKSQLSTKQTIDWLPQVFADQDNCWTQVLLALTDLYIMSKMRNRATPATKKIISIINPHLMFQQFLESLAYDSSVLLDLLTSPETCFLLYFLKYLKLLSQEWHLFKELHQEAGMNFRNESASQVYDEDDCDLMAKTQPQDGSAYGTMVDTEVQSLKNCLVKSEDSFSHSRLKTIKDSKPIKSEIVEDAVDCNVDSPENISYDNYQRTRKDEDISFKIGTKDNDSAIETLPSISDWPMDDCDFDKPDQGLPYNDSLRIQSQPLTGKTIFADDQGNNNNNNEVSHPLKQETGDKETKLMSETSKSSQAKGIGLASIQVYANYSSGSSEDEYYENFVGMKRAENYSLSSVCRNVSDTEEFDNFMHREAEKSQTLRETERKSPEQFDTNTFIDSSPCVTMVTSSISTLDCAMLCLGRLLQLLNRLNRSCVFPYNSQPLVNALEACMALYEN